MSAKTNRLLKEAIECRILASIQTTERSAIDYRRQGFAAENELRVEIARLEAASEPPTDGKGREWHVLVRDGGSVSVYYTMPGDSPHYVVWDSLDHEKAAS